MKKIKLTYFRLSFGSKKRRQITMQYLNRFNYIMAGLHVVQAVVMAIIAKSFFLPVTTTYLTFNESTQSLRNCHSQLV